VKSMKIKIIQAPGRETGFTMIEVMIAILILAGLTAGTVLSLTRLTATVNLRLASDRLAQEIRTTQQRAFAENSPYGIQFYQDPGNAYLIKKTAVYISDTPMVHLPASLTLESNFPKKMLTIPCLEGSANGGTITLTNKANSRQQLYVIVAAITGRVRVSDRPPESWEIHGS